MGFEQQVERQAARYFDDVLPRFVERYFSGEGRELLWRLMDAHDRKELSAVDGVVAGRTAREKARFVEASCPLEVVGTLLRAPSSGVASGMVLGEFHHSTLEARGVLGGSHPISHDRFVTIYEGSFIASGWSDATVEAELFWTIFHEYIHYFESHLLAREQPLASREHGRPAEAPSLAEVKRRDRRALVRKLVAGAAVLGVVALLVWVMLAHAPREVRPGSMLAEAPAAETKEARARREAELARERIAAEEGTRTLVAKLELAAEAGADPLVAPLVVGTRPVCDSAVANSSCDLLVEGHVPANAARTQLWMKPNPDVFPVRLTGLSWTADGGVQRIDIAGN